MKKLIIHNESIKVFILALVSVIIIRFSFVIITFENKLTIVTLIFVLFFLIINKKYLEKS